MCCRTAYDRYRRRLFCHCHGAGWTSDGFQWFRRSPAGRDTAKACRARRQGHHRHIAACRDRTRCHSGLGNAAEGAWHQEFQIPVQAGNSICPRRISGCPACRARLGRGCRQAARRRGFGRALPDQGRSTQNRHGSEISASGRHSRQLPRAGRMPSIPARLPTTS